MNRRAFLKVVALSTVGAGLTAFKALPSSTTVPMGTSVPMGIPSLCSGQASVPPSTSVPISTHTMASDTPVAEYSGVEGEEGTRTYSGKWPALLMGALPQPVREVLERVQPMSISSEGLLSLQDEGGNTIGNVPLVRTQWNQEKSTVLDRLLTEWSWGIVLHWYGEPEYFDKTVTGYLRGFDGLRDANGYETRTSAHFLVGEAPPAILKETIDADGYIGAESKGAAIGVLQTQAPDEDGTPFVASHLRSLNYKQCRDRQQYFVNALDALEFADKGNHSILQDFYAGPRIDPGWRTIAIEVTGFNFDNPETAPGAQQVANVLGVVWAVMKRYKIAAQDVLGHYELSLDKPDPGKLFLSMIRCLLGVKALIDSDEEMKELVFGRFIKARMPDAVGRYFKFVRDYLVLVSRPAQVYTWEKRSQYWMLLDKLTGDEMPGDWRKIAAAGSFSSPLDGEISLMGDIFLEPASHAGVDLYPEREQASRKLSGTSEVRLSADGVCLFTGKNSGGCAGKLLIFRHREPEGAEVLTIYSHLSELSNLQIGEKYQSGHILGKIASPQVFMERYLHFTVAYGATWETDPGLKTGLPMHASPEWIKERFLDPLAYLEKHG